jgi:hypothetical protein
MSEALRQKIHNLTHLLLVITDDTERQINEKLIKEGNTFDLFYNNSKEVKDCLWLEFLIFNIHNFNRLIFDKYGEEYRNEFMDGVIKNLAKNICHRVELNEFIKLYTIREEEYSKHTIEAPASGLKGTLLWEFGKIIAKALGREKNAFTITMASVYGMNYTFYADALKAALETKN